jgi:spore maturation protein CgeB
VVVYPPTETALAACLEDAGRADIIVKASGVGVLDRELERAVPSLRTPRNLVLYWDVDAPATLDRLASDPTDEFHSLVPRYDLVCTYGGGEPVITGYGRVGARRCVPVYNALDESTHYPVSRTERFEGALGFLGNRLPDREKRVEDFFLRAAELHPGHCFVLGGSGWESRRLPSNVRHVGHVGTADHNAFNCSPRAVLNLCRDSMASYGFSPPTRVFEAAGAEACILSDSWRGIELFLEPGAEIVLAESGEELADSLSALTESDARAIGAAAGRRIRAHHTYRHRAAQVERILERGE